MPTLQDIVEALKRGGIGRIGTILFGLLCLIIINLFKSDPVVDAGGNILFGLLIAAAMFLPFKKEQ